MNMSKSMSNKRSIRGVFRLRNLFILAGNGPYDNRGCEAIVRGTVEIIRKTFRNPEFVVYSYFIADEQREKQIKAESDKGIIHIGTCASKLNVIQKGIRKLRNQMFPDIKRKAMFAPLLPFLDNARVVLSVGGDNYSLDYGIPHKFTDLDDYAREHNKPLVIWGASVGPFSADPAYERFMSLHLKKQKAIFARETRTIDYLSSIDVKENVYQVIDPAFAMEPVKPKNFAELDALPGSIGINLSPLLGKFVIKEYSSNQWLKLAVEIVKAVHEKFRRPIFLIPHVFIANSNDLDFLREIKNQIGLDDIYLIGEEYSAAELKWIISQLSIFAGARTHATIASFSSCVPTVSFAYSTKAEGLNQDIYGDLTLCIKPNNLSPQTVCEVLDRALANEDQLRTQLQRKMAVYLPEVYKSGDLLNRIL